MIDVLSSLAVLCLPSALIFLNGSHFLTPKTNNPLPIFMSDLSPISSSKISSDFASRLATLEPQQKIQVIVFFNLPAAANRERSATMETIRQAAEAGLTQIQPLIDQHNGQLLADRPNFLGAIPVEITVSGVYALATSHAVKAIVENQNINF